MARSIWSVLDPDDGLEEATAEQLGARLAMVSPQLKQCVASCKHIAETARQQNNFQNVSSKFIHFSTSAQVETSPTTSRYFL